MVCFVMSMLAEFPLNQLPRLYCEHWLVTCVSDALHHITLVYTNKCLHAIYTEGLKT